MPRLNIATTEQITPFVCTHDRCPNREGGSSFKTKQSLDRHIREVFHYCKPTCEACLSHACEIYVCKRCDYFTAKPRELERHNRAIHSRTEGATKKGDKKHYVNQGLACPHKHCVRAHEDDSYSHKTFSDHRSLTRHLLTRKHTCGPSCSECKAYNESKVYMCALCPSHFVTRDPARFKKHCFRRHGGYVRFKPHERGATLEDVGLVDITKPDADETSEDEEATDGAATSSEENLTPRPQEQRLTTIQIESSPNGQEDVFASSFDLNCLAVDPAFGQELSDQIDLMFATNVLDVLGASEYVS